MRLRKPLAAAIAAQALLLLGDPSASHANVVMDQCPPDIVDYPAYWILQFECGETAPDHGCYYDQFLGYRMFDCTHSPPQETGSCDATGCRVT